MIRFFGMVVVIACLSSCAGSYRPPATTRAATHPSADVAQGRHGVAPPPAPESSRGHAELDPDRRATLDRIDEIVRARFYAPQVLKQRHWTNLVAAARARLAQARNGAERDVALEALLAGLRTSHTEYVPRSSPAYWELASLFDGMFASVPDQCPDRAKTFPRSPVTWDNVGAVWRQIHGRWFVAGVFKGGPADKAGLVLGDEMVRADRTPFSPVASFVGKAGKPVRLEYRRRQSGPVAEVEIVPRRSQPQADFRKAMSASAHIIHRGKARIAYVRVWSWAGEKMQDALLATINRLNRDHPTGFILDIRGGWGGVAPNALGIFDKKVPALDSVDRHGKDYRLDEQIRTPSVVLIDRGSRSGKETIAFGVKKYHLAILAGQRTAGAFMAGSPFCLPDGGLLYLATGRVTVDGVALEGRGVAPDVPVPFDIRFAAGKDLQLARAIDLLAPSRQP